MKLKNTFEIVDMGDEFVMVPIGKDSTLVHGIIKMNNSGREILNLMTEDTSEEELVSLLTRKYDNDEQTIKRYVHEIVKTLSKNDLLLY